MQREIKKRWSKKGHSSMEKIKTCEKVTDPKTTDQAFR